MIMQNNFKITPDVCGLEFHLKSFIDIHNFLMLDNLDLAGFEIFASDGMLCHGTAQMPIPGYIKRSFLAEMREHKQSFETLVLHIYPTNTVPANIDTYQEYKNSQCVMILLLYDALNIEIYSKNQMWLMQMLNDACTLNATNIVLKTEETDEREGMYV